MMQRLLGELIGLARATDGNEHLISAASTAVMRDCLAASRHILPEEKVEELRKRIDEEKRRMIPDCFVCAAPCGKNNAYDMRTLQQEDTQTREAKLQLLKLIQRLAAEDCTHGETERLFYKALIVIGMEDFGPELPASMMREIQNTIT